MELAQAAEDFRLADEELYASADLVADRRFMSWSVLEEADEVAAMALAYEEAVDYLFAGYAIPIAAGMSIAEQLRAFDDETSALERKPRNLRSRSALAGLGVLVD
jgi:hypothetical protein